MVCHAQAAFARMFFTSCHNKATRHSARILSHVILLVIFMSVSCFRSHSLCALSCLCLPFHLLRFFAAMLHPVTFYSYYRVILPCAYGSGEYEPGWSSIRRSESHYAGCIESMALSRFMAFLTVGALQPQFIIWPCQCLSVWELPFLDSNREMCARVCVCVCIYNMKERKNRLCRNMSMRIHFKEKESEVSKPHSFCE